MRAVRALRGTPAPFVVRLIWPSSLLRRSLLFADMDFNDRRWLEIELPAGNGVGTARVIARAYSAFAEGGDELGITSGTLESLMAPHDLARPKDEVMGVASWFSLGFLKPGPEVSFGSTEHAFGTPGAGGSFGFADPDSRLGFAYVMNNMDYYLVDPREKALRDAVYRCIRRLAGRPPATPG